MSKNFELLRQKMNRELGLPPAIAQEVIPPVVRNRRDGYGRIVHLDLASATPQEYGVIVENIVLSTGADSPVVIAFAGIDVGESSSRVTAQVAQMIARRGLGKVCLVDACFRSPSLSTVFGFGNVRGLTDAAHVGGSSILDFTIPVRDGNLSLLPWGSFATGTARHLALDFLKTRVDELRGEFEYVLVNAPRLSYFAGGIAFGQLADGLVLVMDGSSTQPGMALKVMKRLRESRVRILGAVLNQCPIAKRESNASSDSDGKVPGL